MSLMNRGGLQTVPMSDVVHVRILRQVATSRGSALPGPKFVLLPGAEAHRLAASGHVAIVSDGELDEHKRQLDAIQAELDRQHEIARPAREAAERRERGEAWDRLDRALDGSR